MVSNCLWKVKALRLAFPTMSLMSPMRIAKTKTPINQEAVMNRISAMFVGFLFFPIEVAVCVKIRKAFRQEKATGLCWPFDYTLVAK